MSGLVVRALKSIAEIPAAEWDACAGPYNGKGPENPFVAHAFLNALEQSGCVTPRHGWQPTHLLASDADGQVVGAMPLYFKGHSQGEYIFDHGWAEAYERAGGRYYPKLLCAVPFSPVTGPRLLCHPDSDAHAVRKALLDGALALAKRHGISSLHMNFLSAEENDFAVSQGLLPRLGEQFHWHNDGYGDFEVFLAALAARKRKTIKRERRDAVAAGIEILQLSGDAIKPEHWDAFYEFYMDTGSRKWGRPYLNRDFFARLHDSMADRILLVMARRDGQWIAGAWNMIGHDTLYGRNWGCIEHHPFLHFECCYYQAIEHAITHGLARVEAGAQGEHKLARGYLPAPIHSAHWIADPGFRRAVANYLNEERNHMLGLIEALDAHSPFRQTEAEPETE